MNYEMDDSYDYLKNVFPLYYKKLFNKEVAAQYAKAEMYLKQLPFLSIRTCNCEWGFLKRSVDTLYENWLQNEKRLLESKGD